jgi:hypothetical protein
VTARNYLVARTGYAIPYGTVRLSRTTSRTLGTKQRDIVFDMPTWRDVDVSTLSAREISDIKARHGRRVTRP